MGVMTVTKARMQRTPVLVYFFGFTSLPSAFKDVIHIV